MGGMNGSRRTRRSTDVAQPAGGGLVYLGRGEFIPGVPARDLTAAEAAHYATVIAANPAGLYVTPAVNAVDAVTRESMDVEASDGDS